MCNQLLKDLIGIGVNIILDGLGLCIGFLYRILCLCLRLLQDFLAALLSLTDNLTLFHHPARLFLCFLADVVGIAVRIIVNLIALLHDDFCLLKLLWQVIAQFLDIMHKVIVIDEDVACERERLSRCHHILDFI